MLVSEIISMPEDQIEKYYASLTSEQKKALILIEDAEDEGKLLITYGKDMSTEEIPINYIGLYASNWKKGEVVRIDSWRFKCLQHSLGESEVVQEAKKSFRKLILWFKDDKRIDLLDNELDIVLDLIKSLDDDCQGLSDINNEQYQELINLDEKYIQGGEPCPAQRVLSDISSLKIQEPILTENSV